MGEEVFLRLSRSGESGRDSFSRFVWACAATQHEKRFLLVEKVPGALRAGVWGRVCSAVTLRLAITTLRVRSRGMPLLLLLLVLFPPRVLDGQAPDVEVVADGGDDADDEAAVDPDREAEAQEHERDLVEAVAQRARPAEADAATEPGAGAVEHAVEERQEHYVVVGELLLEHVREDDLRDRLRVEQADEENEGDEVVVQDRRLQVEVGGYQGPGVEEGEVAEEGAVRVLGARAACFYHVLGAGSSSAVLSRSRGGEGGDNTKGRKRGGVGLGRRRGKRKDGTLRDARRQVSPLRGVEHEHYATVDHVPFVPGEVVEGIGDEGMRRDAQRREHGLLPEAAASIEGCEDEDYAEREDALDRARDEA